MELKEKLISLLKENPDGLKASRLAVLCGLTRHEINSCLYANKSIFSVDETYTWRMKSSTASTAQVEATRIQISRTTPIMVSTQPKKPTKRYAYCNTVASFLTMSETTWIQQMQDGFHEAFSLPLGTTQIGVWRDCYRVLQEALAEFHRCNPNFHIVFEYALPYESGRRPDVVLVSDQYVIILEFKKKNVILRADVDQAAAYGRDIEEYHYETRGKEVLSYLVVTEISNYYDVVGDDLIFVCSGDKLGELLVRDVDHASNVADIDKWINSKYEPLPTVVDAARMIMAKEDLPNIRRVNSTGIPDAIHCLEEAARYAKENSKHVLALVTGVPGAGKTLLGLQFVYNICEKQDHVNSVYLSGNGPLVEVLKNALHSGVFVKDLHKIEDEYLRSGAKEFNSNVIVFDEGQRAWDIKRMQEKGRGAISEPEIMVRLADERLSWCVMLILVGEGQEIHLGEGSGLSQWNDALRSSHHTWEVICPNKIAQTFRTQRMVPVANNNTLDLTVSLRSHLAGDVSVFVNNLIDGNIISAKRLSGKIKSQGFTMLITRELEKAKEYCRTRYDGQLSKRYGLIASSKGSILPNYGVDNSWGATKSTNIAKWFNTDASSGLSCCNLQKVITEFACQGLELDFPIVCWANDMTWNGLSWNLAIGRSSDGHADLYRTNSYRVLLTRGRDGFIVFVPNAPALDGVYQLMLDVGMDELP